MLVLDVPPPEDEPEPLCPATGSYCTGMFCDDYGCAKKLGFFDDEEDEWL